jgi:Predicted transcriptional regulators
VITYKCKVNFTKNNSFERVSVKKITLEVFSIKNIVSELRKEKGLTQQELAQIMRVSRQTIISLENGKYNPSIMLAHNIAKMFGKTIEEVFIFEEE